MWWRITVSDDCITIPVDGVLDLHAFRPEETLDVVREYIHCCSEQGIGQIRIIHGKGKGVQRTAVRKLLGQLDAVASFRDAEETAGGWGATLVDLRSPEKK
jgi:DNA-nicking Smr family endonuclease